jgi:YD repeat-containing protein
VTVDHDATGRVVEVDPGYTFEYDPDERLMAVRDSGTGDVVEHYAYDADGRLAATYDANGLTQRFAWDGAQMVAARDGNGVAKWDAVWGTLDQLLSWRDLAAHPVGDVAVLPITDHRGSVVGAVESDAGGTTLLAAADYTPMGRVASLDPTDDDAETCREDGNLGTRCAHPGGMPFGFAGAWRSEATGLVYMRFRWYSPPPAYPRSITATTAQASPDPDPDPTATRTSPPVTSVSPGPSATAPAASTTRDRAPRRVDDHHVARGRCVRPPATGAARRARRRGRASGWRRARRSPRGSPDDRLLTGEGQARALARHLANPLGARAAPEPRAVEHGDAPVDAGKRREGRRLGHVREGQAPRPGRARRGVRDQLQRGAAAVLPGHAAGHCGGQDRRRAGASGAFGFDHGARRAAARGTASRRRLPTGSRLTPRAPGRTLPGMWFNTNVLHQPDVT